MPTTKTTGRRRAIKAERLLAQSVYAGLCSTCRFTPECFFAARATTPVMHCEQFDDREATAGHDEPSRRVASGSVGTVQTNPALKGLCLNCEHVTQCAYPKPEGGIWHCEEYA